MSGDHSFIGTIQKAIIAHFSGFYSWTMNFYIFTILLLVFSPLGSIRLDITDDVKPEFSTFSWLAMLFSAGMGIGLFFYSVVEPLSHYLFSFHGAETPSHSLALTIFHWGIHPWACYALVGLCFAYFSFRKGVSVSIRSCLNPFLGKYTQGLLGKLLNSSAVVCPVIGVAISLGLGAMQITRGIEYSFSFDASLSLQITIILSITAISTISVISGIRKGMKYLSILNIGFAFLLLCFIFFSGDILVSTKNIILDITSYSKNFLHHSVWSGQHNYREDGNAVNWTIFHWSSWIAWAPFVGMFIARISKGRTVREFLLGAILIPTLLSAIWFSIFGNSVIQLFQNGATDLKNVLENDLLITFFLFLSKFSGKLVLYGLAIICLKLFFITSADSATLVIATAANERGIPSAKEKIYWSLVICLIAIVFLTTGGLETMQIISIISSIPFGLISWLMIFCLFKELILEKKKEKAFNTKEQK